MKHLLYTFNFNVAMRRFIKNLGFFILFTVVIYSMLLIFWGDYMPDVFKKNLVFPMGYGGHLFTRIRDIPNFKNVDILVLGTSHAYRGFDVRILKEYGYNAFNLGSSFQTPVESLLLLEKFVDTLNPKIIIFDIYPPTFESDGVESSLDLIANYEVNKKILNMAITLNNIKTYNSLIYGYYRQSFNKDMNFKEPLDNGTDKYVSGGFVERKKIEFFLNKDKALNKHKWKPKKYQLNAFEKIINLAKNKNIQLIFVQSPT